MAVQTLAVVDLGSNSFRLEIGRVEGDQIYPLDTWREPLRFGAGLDARGHIKRAAMTSALACLSRFGERLRGLSPTAVRAVATNVFRVAKNSAEFVPRAEAALGFPIEIIPGVEEARLIYVGVSHALPPSPARRLVVDIGGGSTELIVGRRFEPETMESLYMGCVSYTLRYFTDGQLTAKAFKRAQTAASSEIEVVAGEFQRENWDEAYASSGTARALAEILEQNGWSRQGITSRGLVQLRERMIDAGEVGRLKLAALKPERAPVLAGGLAIMLAVVEGLGIETIEPAPGAMRLGVLYDLLGRRLKHDMRDGTVRTFIDRYRIDRAQAQRVAALAERLLQAARPEAPEAARQVLRWAALLHEVGWAVSHTSFHKHSAYILRNADMPGFSRQEQDRLGALALACRGGLRKVEAALRDPEFRTQTLALRFAVLFLHARRPVEMPAFELLVGEKILLSLPDNWLESHPLTAFLLDEEREEWRTAGIDLKLAGR